jgi:hypothetical protein
VKNVTLIDLSSAFNGHGICTAQPWVFSGEPAPDTALASAAEHIVAAKACSGTDVLHRTSSCAALSASALAAENGLEDYVWRAAHPTAAGQRAIAAAVERQLSPRV